MGTLLKRAMVLVCPLVDSWSMSMWEGDGAQDHPAAFAFGRGFQRGPTFTELNKTHRFPRIANRYVPVNVQPASER